jgi:hypothetical protein
MPEANSLLLFILAALTLNVTPGPDMLYIIRAAPGRAVPPGSSQLSASPQAAPCIRCSSPAVSQASS